MHRTAMLSAGALVGVLALTGATLCHAGSPQNKTTALKSGLDKGDMLTAFNPRHVTGADKNTNICPI